MSRVVVDGPDAGVAAAGHHRAGHGRGADERAGLPFVHAAERLGIERACRCVRAAHTAGLQVDRLPPHHARGPGRLGHERDRAQPPGRGRGVVRRGRPGHHAERLGEQTVAREDGQTVAEDDVGRRPAAAQRVVVHRRQVVVHEGVGMDQLDGAGERQDEVPGRAGVGRRVRCVSRVHGVSGGQRQDRAEPLAARGHAVSHRLGDQRRAAGCARQQLVQRVVHIGPTRGQVVGEIVGWGQRSGSSSSACSASGAGRTSPRSFRTSMRRSASSRRWWQ